MESLGTSLPPYSHASIAADIAIACDGSGIMHLHRLPLELDERLVLADVGQCISCVAAVAHDGRTSIFAGHTSHLKRSSFRDNLHMLTRELTGGCSILKSSLPSALPLTSVHDVEFVVIAQLASPPTFLSPSYHATMLLAAIGPSDLVINAVDSKVTTRLEGHVGIVTDAVFCGHACECAQTCLYTMLYTPIQHCNILRCPFFTLCTMWHFCHAVYPSNRWKK
jgi:hypothetical protein